MTRWISLVLTEGTAPPADYIRQEKVLKSLLLSAGKISISNVDPSTVSFILGDNAKATSSLLNCAGKKTSN